MKTNPLVLIVLFGLLIYVALSTEHKFNQSAEQFTARSEGDAIVIAWRDEVRHPMALRLQETYEENSGKAERFIIELNSPGGSVSEGHQVIDVITRMKKTHIIETRVLSNRICASMCVPLYLQGEKRTAASAARFMFHEPTSVDSVTGEEVKQPAFVKRYETRQFVDKYFKESEMSPEWLATLEKEWQGKDIWKTARQLVDERANIVQELR